MPPFFAHEARLIAALAAAQPDAPVPRLLAADGGRMLLAHLPGDDLYGARGALCHAMIDLLVALQAAWQGQGEALRAMGLPDWRGPAMAAALAALVARRGGEFGADERARLDRFVAGLPARFAAIAACGLADGLVHGDFHAGNLRGDPGPHSSGGGRLTLLDWGDSGIGHPLLDQSAFLSRIAPEDVAAARAHWTAAWRRLRPGAQVERAAALLAPVASARMALIYQRFLDGIEAAEHPYHRADVPAWLGRTLQALAAEGGA